MHVALYSSRSYSVSETGLCFLPHSVMVLRPFLCQLLVSSKLRNDSFLHQLFALAVDIFGLLEAWAVLAEIDIIRRMPGQGNSQSRALSIYVSARFIFFALAREPFDVSGSSAPAIPTHASARWEYSVPVNI